MLGDEVHIDWYIAVTSVHAQGQRDQFVVAVGHLSLVNGYIFPPIIFQQLRELLLESQTFAFPLILGRGSHVEHRRREDTTLTHETLLPDSLCILGGD